MLFDVSEFVALVEIVALSELTTEDITKVDAVAASEDTAGELAFATLLVAAGAETLELEVAGKAASPPKISAPVAG